jgi:hypothetical protein
MYLARSHLFAALLLAAVLPACGDDDAKVVPHPAADAGGRTAADAALDAAAADPDAGPDAAPPDATPADAGPPDADLSSDAAPGCSLWSIDRIQHEDVSARVENGALVLSFSGASQNCVESVAPCGPIKVYQRTLHGDFDVSAQVESVDGAGLFAGLSLFVSFGITSSDPYLSASVFGGSHTSTNLIMQDNPGLFGGGGSNSMATTISGTAATLRIRRTGNHVVLSGVAGNDSVELPATGSEDLVVGLALVTGFGHDPTMTARVSSFTVVGGGGSIASDDFDCNGTSLFP